MRATAVLRLAGRDLAARPGRAAAQALGLALGIFILSLTLALGLGARDWLLAELFAPLPEDGLEVVARELDLGLLRLADAGPLSGRPLDAAGLAQLRALPRVAAAWPRLAVALPLGVRGGARILGRAISSDVFVDAVPEALLVAELGPAARHVPGAPLPVALSPLLIDMYNASVAPALGTPRLDPAAVLGIDFDLLIGRSALLGGAGGGRQGSERARVAGVSRLAHRLSLLISLESARTLIARYGAAADETQERYSSVLLRAETRADLPALGRAVEALGYALDSRAQRARQGVEVATAVASSVGLLVLALAASQVGLSQAAELSRRRRELATLRALGARRRDVMALVLLQANALGLAGGVLGVLSAQGAARGLAAAGSAWLVNLPLEPAALSTLPPAVQAGTIAAACLAACLGAVGPAWAAARAPIAEALA